MRAARFFNLPFLVLKAKHPVTKESIHFRLVISVVTHVKYKQITIYVLLCDDKINYVLKIMCKI